MALGELLTYGAKTAVSNAPLALGVLGTAGFVGARGDPGGAVSGVFGSVGGGARGAFSGGVIGSLLGVGAVAAAVAMPKSVGEGVGRMLQSVIRSGPARKVESVMRMAGTKEHLGIANAISRISGMQPQVAAAEFTSMMLKNRQKALLVGAVGGGFAGALAGIPLGATRSAYLAGRRRAGPMGVQG